jgi:hypothetical protein
LPSTWNSFLPICPAMLLRQLQALVSGSIPELARRGVVDPMPMVKSGLLLCRCIASWVSSRPSHRSVAALVAGGSAICPSHMLWTQQAGFTLSHMIHSTNTPTRCIAMLWPCLGRVFAFRLPYVGHVVRGNNPAKYRRWSGIRAVWAMSSVCCGDVGSGV